MFRADWNGAGGTVSRDSACYCPQPSAAVSSIAGHVAFWRGVSTERVPGPGEAAAGGSGRRLVGRIRAGLLRIGAPP